MGAFQDYRDLSFKEGPKKSVFFCSHCSKNQFLFAPIAKKLAFGGQFEIAIY